MKQFFFSSDGEVFVDLSEVICVFVVDEIADGDRDEVFEYYGGRYLSFWLRGARKSKEIGPEYVDEFMDALVAYRRGL